MEEWLSYRLGDFLLFSDRTYWRLFQLQNAATWPLPVVAPLAGAAALLATLWRAALGLRLLAPLLAVAWAFVGWSFVWQRYAPVNWAMEYVAPAFGLQALLLAWAAMRAAQGGVGWNPTLRAPGDRKAIYAKGMRSAIGSALLGGGFMLHPLAAPLFGRPLAQAEVAGLAPDPTAVATLGLALLLPSRALGLVAFVFPALWLAGSALTLWTLGAAEAAVPLLALALAAGGLALPRR